MRLCLNVRFRARARGLAPVRWLASCLFARVAVSVISLHDRALGAYLAFAAGDALGVFRLDFSQKNLTRVTRKCVQKIVEIVGVTGLRRQSTCLGNASLRR